jgi:transposase-like protein
MSPSDFSSLVRQLEELSVQQLVKLAAIVAERARLGQTAADIETQASPSQTCPGCGGGSAVRWGTTSGIQRWRCKTCKKTWNATSGMAVAKVRKKTAFRLFVEDMVSPAPLSCRTIAHRLGINRMTAWRWRHKACALVAGFGDTRLDGIVEADETFQRESRKGSREWVRWTRDSRAHAKPPRLRWRDHGGAHAPMKRGLSRWQIPVLTLADRSGRRVAEVLGGLSWASIGPALRRSVAPDAVLCSDKAQAYKKFAATSGVRHIRVASRKGKIAHDKTFHIQNVNALHSRFKAFIAPFKGPATKYLSVYVGWFLFRDLSGCNSDAARRLWLRALAPMVCQQAKQT